MCAQENFLQCKYTEHVTNVANKYLGLIFKISEVLLQCFNVSNGVSYPGVFV